MASEDDFESSLIRMQEAYCELVGLVGPDFAAQILTDLREIITPDADVVVAIELEDEPNEVFEEKTGRVVQLH